MSLHFHPLVIKQIDRETPDCISVLFVVPEHLAETFRFVPGQNVTLRKQLHNNDVRRSYSICSTPSNGLRVAIKKTADGYFSKFANETLQPGDTLDVMPPTGRFTLHGANHDHQHYVAVAAGSGITPVFSIIAHTLETQPGSRFTLIYGNRTRASIIFKEQLEALKNRYMNRFAIYHVLSGEKTDAELFSGRIDVQKCGSFNKLINWKQQDEYFLCGPEQMVLSVKDFLAQQDVAESKIHYELFTVPGAKKIAAQSETSSNHTDAAAVADVSVRLDAISFNFSLGYEGESILDAAMRQGADLPFSCKGGVCATCKARLVSGAVHLDENFALEPDELAAGFILTCQAHPRTSSVVVDFDLR